MRAKTKLMLLHVTMILALGLALVVLASGCTSSTEGYVSVMNVDAGEAVVPEPVDAAVPVRPDGGHGLGCPTCPFGAEPHDGGTLGCPVCLVPGDM